MWLFLVVKWVCLHFVIEVVPDHTHLLIFVLGLCFVIKYLFAITSRRQRESVVLL